MRRFLTLVCLLGLAIPAGVSISGCYRNPAGKYCSETSGYGMLQSQVAYITLQPELAGLSLAYGQTTQTLTPQAFTCLNTTVSVTSKSYAYGTTNNQLVDISPTGAICAGTWNRNTGGGIADYTYCNPPNPLPNTGGLPYAVAYITATSNSVTSNAVPVYVHPQVTSVSLVGPQSCQSQGTIAALDAQACYAVNGKQYELCAPASVSSANYSCPVLNPGTTIPTCESSIGTMSFVVGTAAVASINANTNQITAELPGTTAITASVAGSGSSAGYFSTCPPASISVTLANGATSGTVTQGVAQNLTTTVYDTNVTQCPPLGCPITGLGLTYQSTNPIDISVGSGGQITTSFPGQASINALCEPSTCNPAPTNLTGFNGTGLPISSNPVNLTTPGTASDYVWFGAPGVSQDFVPLELLTGTVGSTVRLPYVPNSMMMDRGGNSLYFGSAREMMVYSTGTDGITTQAAIPGVVLAVSPNNSQVLVNDQARHLFYIYNTSGAAPLSFPGMGNAAEWTPDSQTLYITDNANLNTPTTCGSSLPITGHSDTLYVYNANTGWSTSALPPSVLPLDETPSCTAQPNTAAALPGPQQTPAILIPSVGAYLRGDPTTAHTWCPEGTVSQQDTITYYPGPGSPVPGGDSELVQSDVLAATAEGHHVLSAQWNSGNTITLHDIAVTIPGTTTTSSNGTTFALPAACSVTNTAGVQTMNPLNVTGAVSSTTLSVSASSVNQVVTGSTPVSVSGGTGNSLAFITYSGTTTGASLPYYLPSTVAGTLGTPSSVSLTGNQNITGPIAGAFSPDNTLFFVSTAGDNMIHYISIPSIISPSTPLSDSKQISPNLPGCDPSQDAGCTYTGTPGTTVPATVIEVKPRSTT